MQDGSWAEAVETLERALSVVQRDRMLILEAATLSWLALAYLGEGARERARQLADDARSAAGMAWPRPIFRVLLATSGSNAVDGIEAELGGYREVAERERARPLEADLHEIDAQIARVRGDLDKHARHLREAHRLYTEMGATGHAKRLARELAALS